MGSVPWLSSETHEPGFSNDVPPELHYLPPLNPKSKEFLDLFRSLLLLKDERTTILALSEEDAKVFIEIIDRVCYSRMFSGAWAIVLSPTTKALRAAKLESGLKVVALNVLRKLCGRIGHLPNSYLLSHKFDTSGIPHASGGFSDVWKGSFKGKNVAVKSLRITESDDKNRIRKVRNSATAPCSGSLTNCAAFLQRSCHVEEPVPPQCSRPHRGP